MINRRARALAAAAAIMLTNSSAHGQNLLANGDFETGDFSGWSRTVQPGSSGSLFVNQTGHLAPISGFFVPASPEGGNYHALTDQVGPGSYSLTQDFTLGWTSRVHINFDLTTDNQAGVAFGNGRDFTIGLNQNATVDILKAGANPLTDDPNDILGVLFGPGSTGIGWRNYDADLLLAAGTYTFRFAETNNLGFFQAGLDNVLATSSPEPEPTSWAMMLGGFGLLGGAMRHRRATIRFA
jgi:hypothetical protein